MLSRPRKAWDDCVQSAGFRVEHLRMALQFTVSCGLATTLICIDATRDFYAYFASLWVFLLPVLIAEPLVGKALMNAFPAIIGSVIGAGLGSGMAALWESVCHNCEHEVGYGPCSKAMTTVLASLGGFCLMLHQMRFPEYVPAFRPGMILFLICLFCPEIFHTATNELIYGEGGIQASNFQYKGLVLLGTLTGAVFTILPSLTVMPLTSNQRIKSLTRQILEDLSRNTESILGLFLQEPDDDGRLPGTSGTDKHLRLVDDGLGEQLKPLSARIQRAEEDIYEATQLLPSAAYERRILAFRYRRCIQLSAFQSILTSAKVVATVHAASLSACSTGRMRLGLCVQNREIMRRLLSCLCESFNSSAGVIDSPSNVDHATEKIQAVAKSLLEVYQVVRVAPAATYDVHLETFTLYTRACLTVGHQLALIFRELSDAKGMKTLAVIAAAFAKNISAEKSSDLHPPDPPSPSQKGSLAPSEKPFSPSPWSNTSPRKPTESRLAQVLLNKIRSFHAEDNPFERPAGSLEGGGFLYNTWSLASQPFRPNKGSINKAKDTQSRNSSIHTDSL